MIVLIGEHEGDYGDKYQRYREVLAVAEDHPTLRKWLDEYVEEYPDHPYVAFEFEKVTFVPKSGGEGGREA